MVQIGHIALFAEPVPESGNGERLPKLGNKEI